MTDEQRPPSFYLGRVGDKLGGVFGPALVARVLESRRYTSDFGDAWFHRMEGATGETPVVAVHDVIWFTTTDVEVVVNAEVLANYEAKRRAVSYARARAEAALGKPEYSALCKYRRDLDQELSALRAPARCAVRRLVAGDRVLLSGTIKAQQVSPYSGREETTLTRCKITVISLCAASAAAEGSDDD